MLGVASRSGWRMRIVDGPQELGDTRRQYGVFVGACGPYGLGSNLWLRKPDLAP